MNRKKFLIISAVVATGVAVPVIMRWSKNAAFKRPLTHPWFLAHLFDKETIRAIGIAYRSKTPSENSQRELTRLLLMNPDGPVIQADDNTAVRQLLEKKAHNDFVAGGIVTADGWILSATEARQCALFSITEN